MDRSLPTWLLALTGVIVAMNLLVFGLFTLVHPELPWPAHGETASTPIRFFAARHIAFGIVLLHGLLKKDRGILRTLFTVFFFLAVVDFGLLAYTGDPIPVLSRLTGELPVAANLALSLGLFVLPMGGVVAWFRKGDKAASASGQPATAA